ncbi:DHA2 family lincomycin resistance protein-like MFS transporter [Subtercola frigoramans]|uniref:DHA2 family lincomycin resistance protein-like MFS transporter n=1 Tax=Subtercola frigoramans TaxID=120298 RepID=A0ABS2L026_9MICO|nr:DHA2 family lincomycin resistance protein-like MFS transporter [Subtercola frigoramans]
MSENTAPDTSIASEIPVVTADGFRTASEPTGGSSLNARNAGESQADADTRIDARNRLVIGILLVSAFVVILNETIMSVALPRLMSSLSIPAESAQWLTTAFMLTMAVVIPITGFLLQRFNTRPVFIAAMTFFSLGTLISATAAGFEILLVGRVIQACGTAIMMPLLMTTVMTLVPPASRGRTMGNISIVISVAPAIGPTISGLILSVLDWRWMFWLVLPIALAALVLGALRIPNVTTPRRVPFDVFSVILSAIGFGGLVYGLTTIGGGTQLGVLPNWVPLAVGIAGLAAFILRQLALQRSDRALLDLRTFTSKNFTLSIVMFAISMMALFGTLILLPLYLQNVLGLDTLATGLLLLPGGLIMGVLAPFVGRIYDRRGPGVLLVPGAIIVSVVLWVLTQVTSTTPVWMILIAHIVLSIGLALMFTPLFTASLGSLKPALYSHGSAVVGTVQQVAGAAGTALFVTIMATHAASLIATGVDPVLAQTDGIRAAFFVGAVISLAAVVVSFFVRKPADNIGGGEMAGISH